MVFPVKELLGRVLLLTAVLMASLGQVHAENLLRNGDFESDNTNFSTTYTYNPPGTDSTPGTYAVVTNAQTLTCCWVPSGITRLGKGSC